MSSQRKGANEAPLSTAWLCCSQICCCCCCWLCDGLTATKRLIIASAIVLLSSLVVYYYASNYKYTRLAKKIFKRTTKSGPFWGEGTRHSEYEKDAKVQTFLTYEDFKNYKGKLGYYNSATLIRVGDKTLVIPALSRLDYSISNGPLRPVQNVSHEELQTGVVLDRSVIGVLLVMEAFLRMTNRPCIAMHHFEGYKGDPKNIIGILTNNGDTFIGAINFVINGKSDTALDGKLDSTMCPTKSIPFNGFYSRIAIRYISVEDLDFEAGTTSRAFKNQMLNKKNHKKKTKRAEQSGDDTTSNTHHEKRQRKPSMHLKSSKRDSASKLKVDKKAIKVNNKFINIKEHWFDGDTSICLQAIQKEMEGEDLCK